MANFAIIQRNILRKEKYFFVKKYSFIIIFGFWVENFRTFAEKFSERLSKLHSTCPEDYFEERYIYFENFNFSSFSDFEQNILGFWQKLFGRVFKTAFYLSRGTFWGKIYIFEKFNFLSQLRTVSEKFRTFAEKFSAGLWTLHFTCSDKHLRVFKKFSRMWQIFANIR